jgi:hypothetical protein
MIRNIARLLFISGTTMLSVSAMVMIFEFSVSFGFFMLGLTLIFNSIVTYIILENTGV